MITKEIIVNGKKEIIVVKIPEELKEDYIDDDLEKTKELNEIIEDVKGDTNE